MAGAGMGTTNADEVLDAAADEGDGPAEDSNSLTSIDVFNNGFGPQGMGILANAMISSTTVSLERLYIGSNRLGPGMPFFPSFFFFFFFFFWTGLALRQSPLGCVMTTVAPLG